MVDNWFRVLLRLIESLVLLAMLGRFWDLFWFVESAAIVITTVKIFLQRICVNLLWVWLVVFQDVDYKVILYMLLVHVDYCLWRPGYCNCFEGFSNGSVWGCSLLASILVLLMSMLLEMIFTGFIRDDCVSSFEL